jgi:TolA-binding protein
MIDREHSRPKRLIEDPDLRGPSRAVLLRAATPAPLTAASIARIRAGVDAKSRGAPRSQLRMLVAAVCCVALAFVGSLAVARTVWPELLVFGDSSTPRVRREHALAPHTVAPQEQPPQEIVAPLPERPTPAPSPSPARPRRARAASPSLPDTTKLEEGASRANRAAAERAPRAEATQTVAREPSEASDGEAQLIRDALEALHARRDPRLALDRARQYAARYPGGALCPEATRIAVDALLALGDTQGALAELEAIDPSAMPRAAELYVIRGELRQRTKDHRRALEDFDKAMVASGSSEIEEQAMIGRASALEHLGRPSEARAALDAYLERHPDGRYAKSARASLQGKRK